jgi:hypothetical protein
MEMDWELVCIRTEDLLDEIRGPLQNIIEEFLEKDKTNGECTINRIMQITRKVFIDYFNLYSELE